MIIFYFNRLEAISLLPVNPGGHAIYQDTFVSDLLKFYSDPFALPKNAWDYIVQFWYLDLSQSDSIMQECYSVLLPESHLPNFLTYKKSSLTIINFISKITMKFTYNSHYTSIKTYSFMSSIHLSIFCFPILCNL